MLGLALDKWAFLAGMMLAATLAMAVAVAVARRMLLKSVGKSVGKKRPAEPFPIERLEQLRDSGEISSEEFSLLRRHTLGLPTSKEKDESK